MCPDDPVETDSREPQSGPFCVEVPACSPRPWPRDPHDLPVRVVGAGREMTLEEFLDLTSTTALVVVVDGVVVHERYSFGTGPADRLLGYSATKSALALLIGLAHSRGELPNLDAPVRDYVPELTGTGYHRVTVRHVLTMTSGVAWVEDYRDPDGPAARMLARWQEGRGGLRSILPAIPAQRPPGTRFAYCTPDSLVLDWVRERATGSSFPDAVADLLCAVGAERPAIVGLDAPLEHGGIAMAAGGLAATARDWARLGVLQVDGCWDGVRLLDGGWVRDSSRPAHDFTAPGRLPGVLTTHAGFGYHWWPLDADGNRVMADGMRGQFVYVDRPGRTVVVKTSDWEYDDPWQDRQCRDLCYLALPAIAQAARRLR